MIQALELNDMVNIRGGHSQGCEQIEKRQGSVKSETLIKIGHFMANTCPKIYGMCQVSGLEKRWREALDA